MTAIPKQSVGPYELMAHQVVGDQMLGGTRAFRRDTPVGGNPARFRSMIALLPIRIGLT